MKLDNVNFSEYCPKTKSIRYCISKLFYQINRNNRYYIKMFPSDGNFYAMYKNAFLDYFIPIESDETIKSESTN